MCNRPTGNCPLVHLEIGNGTGQDTYLYIKYLICQLRMSINDSIGCRQNLDPLSGPPSGPLNFFSEKRNNKFKLFIKSVLHTTASFALLFP